MAYMDKKYDRTQGRCLLMGALFHIHNQNLEIHTKFYLHEIGDGRMADVLRALQAG